MISKKRIYIILSIILGILLIPFIAMQFTNEVNWNLLDFVVMGSLLFMVGLVLDYIIKKVNKKRNKFIQIFGILSLFLLLWIELAVGIFNSPFAGN